MGEIARNQRQITFYYNPDSSVAKKALGYLQEAEVPVLTINLLDKPLTGSQWLEIADGLGMEISELVLKDHPVFTKQYLDADLSVEDWLKIIRKHPEIVDQPIAVRGEKILLVRTPTEILQLLKAKFNEA
jgi:arsenate reductase